MRILNTMPHKIQPTPQTGLVVIVSLFCLLITQSLSAQAKSGTPVDQRYLPGCRVLIVDSDKVKPIEGLTTLTTFPAQVAKIVAEKKGGLVIRGFDGFGAVPANAVILLRNLDAKKLIESSFSGREKKLALAEFANLHDADEALKLYRELVDSEVEYDWPRVRLVDLMLQYNMTDQVAEVLEPIGESSGAWSLKQVQMAVASENVDEQVARILDEDPNNVHALKVLARLMLIKASDSSRTTDDRMHFAEQLAAKIVELEKVLSSDVEVAWLKLKLMMIAQQCGIEFSDEQQMTVIKVAMEALSKDPFSPNLLISISHSFEITGRSEAAIGLARTAAENFPRYADAISSFSLIAWNLASEKLVIASDPAVAEFSLAYNWPLVSQGIDRIARLDIPRTTSHLPFRNVDGDGRRDLGFLLDEETGLNACQLLCAIDNIDTLRFLDDKYEKIDYRFGEVDGVTLSHFCAAHDSFNSLAFLMEKQVPFDLASSKGLKPIDWAIACKSIVCTQLLWNSGERPNEEHQTALCNWLKCKPDQLSEKLAASAIDRMVEDFELRNGDALLGVVTARSLHFLGGEQIESAQQLRALGVGAGAAQFMPAPVFVPSDFKNDPSFVQRAIQDAVDQSLPTVTQEDRNNWNRTEQAGIEATVDAKQKFEFYNRRLKAALGRAELVSRLVLQDEDFTKWRRKIEQLDDSPLQK